MTAHNSEKIKGITVGNKNPQARIQAVICFATGKNLKMIGIVKEASLYNKQYFQYQSMKVTDEDKIKL